MKISDTYSSFVIGVASVLFLSGCSATVGKYKDHKPLSSTEMRAMSCNEIDSKIQHHVEAVEELGGEIDVIAASKVGGLDTANMAQETLAGFDSTVSTDLMNITGALGILGTLGSAAAAFDESKVKELTDSMVKESQTLFKIRNVKGCA